MRYNDATCTGTKQDRKIPVVFIKKCKTKFEHNFMFRKFFVKPKVADPGAKGCDLIRILAPDPIMKADKVKNTK